MASGTDGSPPPPELIRGIALRRGEEASRLLREMPKPTIAMVNGPVAGAGIGIAGSCDLRFASTTATFLSAYERIGGAGDSASAADTCSGLDHRAQVACPNFLSSYVR